MRIRTLAVALALFSATALAVADDKPASSSTSDFLKLANSGEKETRNLIVKVLSFEPQVKSMLSLPDNTNLVYDRVRYEVLSPADYKGKKWHIYILSLPTDAKKDWNLNVGQIVELDTSSFHISKAAFQDFVGSEAPNDGMYVEYSS